MLNREEYNATFKHDLSQEEFEKLKPIILGSDNIKTIESLSFVDPETHELTEFVQVVRCKNCIACRKQDDYEYWCTAQSPAYLVAKDGFCSRGNRVKCTNVVCGYCQDGRCYNDHETKVVHVCPRGYGKEKNDE